MSDESEAGEPDWSEVSDRTAAEMAGEDAAERRDDMSPKDILDRSAFDPMRTFPKTLLWLPLGTVVEVTWSGGNGPHLYRVDGHNRDGCPRLASDLELRVGLPGGRYLDGYVGEKPLTVARVVGQLPLA